MKRDQSKNGDAIQRGFQHLQEAQAKLTEAMASLVANQAAFQGEMREIERERRESEGERLAFQRESEERFHRIERILEFHTQLLQALPDAIREKMGFRKPGE